MDHHTIGDTFKRGTRVQLHAACDEWMPGDRFGTVVGLGLPRLYAGPNGERSISQPVRVKLDKSGRTRRFHPSNLFVIAGVA